MYGDMVRCEGELPLVHYHCLLVGANLPCPNQCMEKIRPTSAYLDPLFRLAISTGNIGSQEESAFPKHEDFLHIACVTAICSTRGLDDPIPVCSNCAEDLQILRTRLQMIAKAKSICTIFSYCLTGLVVLTVGYFSLSLFQRNSVSFP